VLQAALFDPPHPTAAIETTLNRANAKASLLVMPLQSTPMRGGLRLTSRDPPASASTPTAVRRIVRRSRGHESQTPDEASRQSSNEETRDEEASTEGCPQARGAWPGG
jgi:hypothetical protein